MNDYDIDYDETCPHCGHTPTHSRPCQEIGCDDGYIDLHEFDDPLWYDIGEIAVCDVCNGTGIEVWCPVCGKDPRTEPSNTGMKTDAASTPAGGEVW